MQNKNEVTVWPLLYFQANWPAKQYGFECGIKLIKAEKSQLEKITEWSSDNNCWLSNIEGADNMHKNTEWFLVMHPPEVIEHVSISEKGMSFVDKTQKAVVGSFLLCLQLVRSTAAVCPFEFIAKIQEDSIEEIDTSDDDFYGINSDKPHICFPEPFEIGDLQLLVYLWSVLVKLRKLDVLVEMINKEEFFAACDKPAGEDAKKRLVDTLMSNPSVSNLPEEERKELLEIWTTSFEENPFWKEYYKESFKKVFLKKQEEIFSDRTRIGRALNLFYQGISLPKLHGFLSMALVLETLFTIGKGETVYKLAVRLAKIVGEKENLEKRKEIYQKAKIVYDERSNVVHGEKLIEVVDDSVLKDAFALARKSLQQILLNSELLELYSHPGTTDKKLKGKGKIKEEAGKALSEYFLKLDLNG